MDDVADPALIETLVTVVPFENLEVRTDGTVAAKFIRLLLVDPACAKCGLQPLPCDGPNLADRKGLSKVGKIAERWHGLDVLLCQLLSGSVEIELALEMMHPGLEERLAV